MQRWRSGLAAAGVLAIAGACGQTDAGSGGEGETTGTTGSACGDGVLDPDETCDDGNVDAYDGCEADCTASATVEFVGPRCVRLLGGDIRCWGPRVNALRDATYGDDEPASDAPMIEGEGIVHLDRGAGALVLDDYIECRLREDASVWCADNHNSDFKRVNIGPAVSIDVSGARACAVLEDGTVHCWGVCLYHGPWPVPGIGCMGYGDLDAEPVDWEEPFPALDFEEPVAKLALGWLHACILTDAGEVRCWGTCEDWMETEECGYGDLPPGCVSGRCLGSMASEAIGNDESPSLAGVVDLGGPAVDLVANGSMMCALRGNGEVVCWGMHSGPPDADAIGDDETPAEAGVVDVEDVAELSQLAGFALDHSGRVLTWDVTAGETEASFVDIGGTAVDIEAACALTDAAAVRCWAGSWLGNGHGAQGCGEPECDPTSDVPVF